MPEPSDPGRPGAASSNAETLERVERLEKAIRTLSVISHRINNPLTALLGRAQILRARVEADPQMEKAAQVIEESATRIAELGRELSKVLRESRLDIADEVLASESSGAVTTRRSG